MHRIIVISVLLLLCSMKSSGQDEKLVQLSGMVRNELLEPVQFAHIVILNQQRGTISGFDGMFTFVVTGGDTVKFSAVGFQDFYLSIPEQPRKDQYHVEIRMKTDTIMIGEVTIMPWKNYQEFRDAFISLKLPDDDLKRAYKNISLIMAQLEMPGSPDPSLNYKFMLNDYYNNLYDRGQLPYYSVFDPLRWRTFFQYLEEGRFRNPDKRKKKR